MRFEKFVDRRQLRATIAQMLAIAPAMAGRDLRVLASDLAPHALRKAEAATYSAKDLKAVPSDLAQAWAHIEGDTATIDDLPRSVVRFRLLNLLGEWPMSGKFDTIFCRNVMIYFDNATQRQVLQQMHAVLKPQGLLYVGHSENFTDARDLFHLRGKTIYERV